MPSRPAQDRDRTPGRLPIVFVELPACPACREYERLKCDRTQREAPGCVTRYMHCRACGQRFKVAASIPEAD